MKRIRSMSFATIVTVATITIITIIAELSEGFKNALKSVTGHHWITKSVFSIIFFFSLYFLLVRTDDNLDVLKEVKMIVWVTMISSLIIIGFFAWHFMSG